MAARARSGAGGSSSSSWVTARGASPSSAAGAWRRSPWPTNVGHAQRRTEQRRPGPPCPDHGLSRGRARPVRATWPPAGGTASSARGRRSTPNAISSSARTCSADARGRPVRPRRPRTGSAYGSAVPDYHHPRPGRRRSCAGRSHSASGNGRASWGARWVGCASSNGASAIPRECRRAVVLAVGAAATAEQIALCSLQIRAIRNDPAFAGGDYYATGVRPVDGLSLARGIGQVTYRTANELQGPVRTRRPRLRRTPSKAGGSRWSHTWSTTGTSWSNGSTRTPTSC